MANGADEKTAERFARTKFAEAFWQNNGQTPIRVGNRTVRPTLSNTDEVMRNWNATYTGTGFERRLGDNRPYRQKMADVGINQSIRRFIDAMGIDTQPSFFRDRKTASFNMPVSTRIVGYADGIRALEMDVLTTGVVTKVYHQGRLFRIVFETTKEKEASKDGPYRIPRRNAHSPGNLHLQKRKNERRLSGVRQPGTTNNGSTCRKRQI